MNQEQNETSNGNKQEVTPILPTPPVELSPDKISAPTYRDSTIPPKEVQEQIPSDMKAANLTSQIALFISMGILAVILIAMLFYFA